MKKRNSEEDGNSFFFCYFIPFQPTKTCPMSSLFLFSLISENIQYFTLILCPLHNKYLVWYCMFVQPVLLGQIIVDMQ